MQVGGQNGGYITEQIQGLLGRPNWPDMMECGLVEYIELINRIDNFLMIVVFWTIKDYGYSDQSGEVEM